MEASGQTLAYSGTLTTPRRRSFSSQRKSVLTLLAALLARVAAAALKWSPNINNREHIGGGRWNLEHLRDGAGGSSWEGVRGHSCSTGGAVLLKEAQNPPCFISAQTGARPGRRRPDGSVPVCLLRQEEDYT